MTFERGKAHVLVEHEGTLFLVPRYLVEPEPAPKPGGTCTVVAVNRKVGSVAMSGTAANKTAAARALEASLRSPSRVGASFQAGSNRKARRAAASARRVGR